MKNNLFKVDGRFYYGWIMVVVAAMPMAICYVIKTNCGPLFLEPLTAELGISRTAYTQTNTVMTVVMLITSIFIGKIFRKFPTRWVLVGSSVLTTVCYLLMSRSTSLWQLIILSGIQGIGWAGNTSLSTSIMIGNWFGPKIKGTVLSIAMAGSAVGALIWISPVQSVLTNYGWRAGYLALAAINVLHIIISLLIFTKPADKGYTTRPGDPLPDEGAEAVDAVEAGITGMQALKTSRWWFQWFAAFLTMIAAGGFSYHFKAYYAEIMGGDSASAAALYSAALGTLVVGKFVLGAMSDILKIKRTAVIAPLFFMGVFICIALSADNMVYAKIMMPLYAIGGAIASVIPFLINGRNFGNKEYAVLQGWMIMAGNAGQIVGPTIASAVYDITGNYRNAWIIFAVLCVLVSVLYFLSTRASTKQIKEMGYVAVD